MRLQMNRMGAAPALVLQISPGDDANNGLSACIMSRLGSESLT